VLLTGDDDVVGGSREGVVLVPRHTPETEIETRVTFDANIFRREGLGHNLEGQNAPVKLREIKLIFISNSKGR